jgi:hypothetical protein
MSNEVHDNHGQTPAAWTAVTIIMIAFIVGSIAVVIAQPWLFWVSVAFCGVGVLVGKVMSMRGYGAKAEDTSDQPQSVEQG